jgi:hypothetical protein
MEPYAVFKLVHIVCVLCLVGGMLGRGVVRTRIGQVGEIDLYQELVHLEGIFDRLVIAGSSLTLLSGILLALLGHWPLLVHGHPTWTLLSLLLFLSLFIPIFAIFVPRGKRFGRVFQEALATKRITQELRTAFSDRTVQVAYLYEVVVIGLLLVLMVLKPF